MINIPQHIKKVILKNSHKSAFFLYDLEVMKKQLDLLKCLPVNVDTYYAMKANPHKEVVKQALKHKNVKGIEIASKGEAEKVLESKEELSKIKNLSDVIYTGPSKSYEELKFVMENKIKYLNVESLKEVIQINEIAKHLGIRQEILLRLNTKHKFKKGEAGIVLGSGDTQFGFPEKEIEKIISYIKELPNVKIKGFHMYPATGVINANVLLKSVDSTFKFIKDLENKTGMSFEVIDFGGGFGIDYEGNTIFDILKYAEGLKALIEKYKMKNKNLILELGRYISADMGYFVTKVNDIKTLQSGIKAVLTLAGTNAHKRPQVLGVDYKLAVVKNPNAVEKNLYKLTEEFGFELDKVKKENVFNVYGPFCTSVDKIAWDKNGEDIELGDFIVQLQAGAYGKTMSPQKFLSHPEVEEIII